MEVTLDFWCPIMHSFGSDFQSSDCGQHVATSISGGFSCCEALDTGMQVTNTSALEWSVIKGVDEDPVIIQVALHSGSTSPIVLVSRTPLATCSWEQPELSSRHCMVKVSMTRLCR